MTSNNLSIIFSKLPDDVKYSILQYAICSPSSKALKIYLGWYNNFLKLNNKNISFTPFLI
jgi:hypothetical protein